MNEEQFDRLWSEAEAEGLGRRLATEYPAWRQRQRRVGGVVAMLLVTVGLAVPMLTGGGPAIESPDGYAAAYCNRADISDQYWVDMASDLLLETA